MLLTTWCPSARQIHIFLFTRKILLYRKTVKKVVTDSGNVITGQKEILNEVSNYYKNVFRSRDAELLDCSVNDLNSVTGVKKL